MLLVLGLAILANTRPYERLAFSIPILVVLTRWLVRGTRRTGSAFLLLLPAGVLTLLIVAAMAYYFWRTTGSPTTSPYQVYTARYEAEPLFPWSHVPKIPEYRFAEMKQFYLEYSLGAYRLMRLAPWLMAIFRMFSFWFFFVGPALTLPFLVIAWILPYGIHLRDFTKKTRLLLVANLVSFGSLLLPVFFHLHYAAPMICAWYALLLFTMRKIWLSDRNLRERGKFVVRGVVAVCVIMFAVRLITVRMPSFQEAVPLSGSIPSPKQSGRSVIADKLKAEKEGQLVILRYGPNHVSVSDEEWVYNDAEIDGSKVVWARDMGTEKNQELIDYFKDRRVWLLQPDADPPTLTDYPAPSK